MNEVVGFFIASFVSLFTIMNPFSTATVFHNISSGNTKAEKKFMAKRATVIAAVVLIVFTFLGAYILDFFSVTMEAFRIAGGILVFGVGYKMISTGKEHFSSDKEEKHAVDKEDVSIIPLAIPMLSGPGAMTTALVLMNDAGGEIFSVLSIILSILIVCVISYIALINANALDSFLGETGTRVTDKILGLIVLVIGIQFVINGVKALFTAWMGVG